MIRIAQKREDAITREVTAKADKKTKKEIEDRIWSKVNEVAEFEASTYSIFYNNSLFLIILLFTSFFLFKNFNPVL
jgi:translocon-associated protein subunit gamma